MLIRGNETRRLSPERTTAFVGREAENFLRSPAKNSPDRALEPVKPVHVHVEQRSAEPAEFCSFLRSPGILEPIDNVIVVQRLSASS